MNRNPVFLSLLFVCFAVATAFAQDGTAGAVPKPFPEPQSLFEALIPFLTPLLIAVVKFIVPRIPRRILPWLAPLFGALISWTANAAGMATNPVMGAILGAAGVAVREAYDQARKGLPGLKLPLLLFGVWCLGFGPGCASQKTHVLETHDSTGLITRSIDVKTRTFFDSRSRLADYDATASETGQGVKIGELSQESYASNIVRIIDRAAEAYLQSKGGAFGQPAN